MSSRIVCGDSLEMLAAETAGAEWAAVTSLPDATELELDLEQWATWFVQAAGTVLLAADPAVFYQTDRRAGGVLVSKADLLFHAVRAVDGVVYWHRIVLRRPPGGIDVRRPGYAHLIAAGLGRSRPGRSAADVLPVSPTLYRNGIPREAATAAARYVAEVGAERVVDPFCGRGTALLAADELGLDTLGIDVDEQACAAARGLLLEEAQ